MLPKAVKRQAIGYHRESSGQVLIARPADRPAVSSASAAGDHSGIRLGRREFPELSLLLDSIFWIGCDRDLNGRTRFERDLLTVRVVQGVIDANFTI